MPLSYDNKGESTDLPSTEELLDKHCLVTTPDNAVAHFERMLPTEALRAAGAEREAKSALGAAAMLALNEKRQKDRAEVRKTIVPILLTVQEAIDDILDGAPKFPLFKAPMKDGQLDGRIGVLDGAELQKILRADFPTLRHFVAEIRDSMTLLMTYGLAKAWKTHPDRQGMQRLGHHLAERFESKKKQNTPAQALKGVLMASFNTPVLFYWDALNAMFERSQMQRGRFLSRTDVDALVQGQHQIVDAISTKSMVHFKPIETQLSVGEELPEDLRPTLGTNGTSFWNPDLVWLSGAPDSKEQRLELSEELFQGLPPEPSYEPVTCSGRGRPMAWFQGLFERMVNTYVQPLLPELNTLAVHGLSRRMYEKSHTTQK